jgi:glycosyltransferase involved in cell wall biosynthesis
MRTGICTKWIDEPFTGVGRYTLSVLRHMMDLDNAPEFHLIHMDQSGEEVYKRAARELVFKPLARPLWWVSQDRFCQRISADLDVIHEPFVGFRRSMACPQVLTFHDAIPFTYPEYAPRSFGLYFRYLMPKVVRKADAIICNSETTAADLVSLMGADREKVHVTYLGVDHVELGDVRAEEQRGPYVLTLSNTPMKNVEYTISEFSSYKDVHGGDLRLLVVGTDYSGLSQKRKDVVTLQHLPRDKLMSLMAGAQALLFPSLYEGFGFPPLEAMAMGVPTVVSDRGSLPEVTGDASLVVDIDKEGDMAGAIDRLMTEEGLASELVRKGKDRYRMFTWDKCARGTVEVYEGLLPS